MARPRVSRKVCAGNSFGTRAEPDADPHAEAVGRAATGNEYLAERTGLRDRRGVPAWAARVAALARAHGARALPEGAVPPLPLEMRKECTPLRMGMGR